MTRLDISGMPLATKKVETLEEAKTKVAAMMKAAKEAPADPRIEKIKSANGGELPLKAIVDSKEFSEEEKTFLAKLAGYQYP